MLKVKSTFFYPFYPIYPSIQTRPKSLAVPTASWTTQTQHQLIHSAIKNCFPWQPTSYCTKNCFWYFPFSDMSSFQLFLPLCIYRLCSARLENRKLFIFSCSWCENCGPKFIVYLFSKGKKNQFLCVRESEQYNTAACKYSTTVDGLMLQSWS